MFKRIAFLGFFLVQGFALSAQIQEPIGCVFQVEGMPDEVAEVMRDQLHAWNRGDLTGFMQGYWESDSLMFVGSNGVTYGHRATLERYQKSYPTQEAMGILTFVNSQWITVSPDAGYLFGQWMLSKETEEDIKGVYTLLWRNGPDGWVIISDHSS